MLRVFLSWSVPHCPSHGCDNAWALHSFISPLLHLSVSLSLCLFLSVCLCLCLFLSPGSPYLSPFNRAQKAALRPHQWPPLLCSGPGEIFWASNAFFGSLKPYKVGLPRSVSWLPYWEPWSKDRDVLRRPRESGQKQPAALSSRSGRWNARALSPGPAASFPLCCKQSLRILQTNDSWVGRVSRNEKLGFYQLCHPLF